MKKHRKILKRILKWRKRQKRGAIMKPETFEAIKRSAMLSGMKDPEAVAGAAYWKAVRSKYKKAHK